MPEQKKITTDIRNLQFGKTSFIQIENSLNFAIGAEDDLETDENGGNSDLETEAVDELETDQNDDANDLETDPSGAQTDLETHTEFNVPAPLESAAGQNFGDSYYTELPRTVTGENVMDEIGKLNGEDFQEGELVLTVREQINKINYHIDENGFLFVNAEDADRYSIDDNGNLIYDFFTPIKLV